VTNNSAMATHPEIFWAQRSSASDDAKNLVYLTINVPDLDESTVKLDLTNTSISFKATAKHLEQGQVHEKAYEFSLDFYSEIIEVPTTRLLTSRHLSLTLRKKEKKAEYWPRLSKAKDRSIFIKTDFSKWVDEDEQDGEPAKMEEDFTDPMGDVGGMDFEKMMATMGSQKAPPAVPNEEDDDSDDGGPPPLEEV